MDFSEKNIFYMDKLYDSQKHLEPSDAFRSDILFNARFELRRECSGKIPNLTQFENIMLAIGDRVNTQQLHPKIKDPVMMTLGPENIDKHVRSVKEQTTYLFLLLDHATKVVTLVANRENDETEKKIRQMFPCPAIVPEPVDLPCEGLMFHFEGGQPPKLIRSPADSHFALVKEDADFLEKLGDKKPEDFYEEMTKHKVVSSRILSFVEKLAMEPECKIKHAPLRLIEFESSTDRNAARNENKVKFLEEIFNNRIIYENMVCSETEVVLRFTDDDDELPDLCNMINWTLFKFAKLEGLAEVPESVPWTVKKIAYQTFEVRFLNDQASTAMLKYLKTSSRSNIFSDYLDDSIKVEVQQVFRELWPMTRELRGFHNSVLRDIDLELRTDYQGIRLYDLFKDGDDIGLMGVEASRRYLARESATEIIGHLNMKLTLSAEDGITTNQLHGMGEAYIRSPINRSQIIDIDKFSGKIVALGNEGIEGISIFRYSGDMHNIYHKIHLTPPFFNCAGLIGEEDVEKINASLGVNCSLDGEAIQFEGSLEAYEILIGKLLEISKKAYAQTISDLQLTPLVKECPVCLTDGIGNEDFYRFECGHTTCRPCCNRYIVSCLNDTPESPANFAPKCLQEGCERILTPKEFLRIILGDGRRTKSLDSKKLRPFISAAKKTILRLDPDVQYCQATDCQGVLVRQPGSSDVGCTDPTCKAKFCGDCLQRSHDGMSCSEALNYENTDEDFENYITESRGDNKIMRCPKCRTAIQKKAGCNHMLCECEQHFCWICGKATESEQETSQHLTEEHGRIGDWDRMVDSEGEEVDVEAQEREWNLIQQRRALE